MQHSYPITVYYLVTWLLIILILAVGMIAEISRVRMQDENKKLKNTKTQHIANPNHFTRLQKLCTGNTYVM